MSDETVDVLNRPPVEDVAAAPTVFRDGLFRGQVVLVSGAAGGIGFATAVLFGRLGATIVSCSRDPEHMSWLRDKLEQLEIPCFTHTLTIRDPDQVDVFMADVWDRCGRLDVLVNNAGGQFAAPALDISPKGWNAVIDTNLSGSWYMMQAAARRWRDHEQAGCIVNMVAVLSMCRTGGIPHTVAARAGEIHLSKALSVEWAPYDIRINCVAVGVVASPGLVNYPESAKPSFDHNPMRRLGSVQDVAQACVYLSAPSGAFITGTVLTVDGGADVWGEYWPLGRPAYYQVDY
jgi:NAD(P)-dependent dehydrogenase (short-subunit alcohol dehydrogenase family)